MDDRFNTIAGWTLFAGIVALGLNSISSHYFQADKAHRPHHMGYAIEGVVEEGGGKEEVAPIETRLASADVAKGEAVFKKCMACHTIAPGAPNGIGPNLHGVVGEGIGKGAGGFPFSDALKSHGGNWDWASLDAWLKSPSGFAQGTKMTFAGLPNPQDRADVIAYLNSQGSNLPLPAAPAAAAAAPEGEAAKAAAAPAEGAAAPAAAESPAAH
jgi:cytochrome c